MKRLLTIFVLTGCPVPEAVDDDPTPRCDGVLQEDEGSIIDSTFDADNDGFKDKDVVECHDIYDPAQLDCDDDNPNIRPNIAETTCNGIDDDCNETTPDSSDADADGVDNCTDCDDNDDGVFPGNEEACWDGIDNDCDATIDNDCGFNYNGVFAIDEPTPLYSCFLQTISIDFDEITVIYVPPAVTVFNTHGIQPGTLDGEFDQPGVFVLEKAVPYGTPAGCDEYYRLSGEFLDADTFTATLEVVFGQGICLNCANQAWEVTGHRVP